MMLSIQLLLHTTIIVTAMISSVVQLQSVHVYSEAQSLSGPATPGLMIVQDMEVGSSLIVKPFWIS